MGQSLERPEDGQTIVAGKAGNNLTIWVVQQLLVIACRGMQKAI